MSTFSDQVRRIGVVPVIKLDSPEQAVPLAKALKEGCVPIAEVTFRTDAAEESIRLISRDVPDVLLGAGTVLTTEQVERAHAAGAKFIVSPGFDQKVVERSLALSLPVFPGCATPTEIMMALSMGLSVVKFFPAGNYGGLGTIKALAAAFPQVEFMPTGGIGPANLAEYLSFSKVLACGGSWMVNLSDLDKTVALCKEARDIVKGVRP